MGKIRVKTFGDEAAEKEQQKKEEKRKEAKTAKKTAKGAHGADERSEGARLLDRRGSEKVISVEPSEEELTKIEVSTEEKVPQVSQAKQEEKVEKKKKDKFKEAKKSRSKRYSAAIQLVDRKKVYPLSEALGILEKMRLSSFDETVELHVNTSEAGLSGMFTLPHGTGKTIKVAIADPTKDPAKVDELVKKVESGNIDFDVLIAHPAAMPKLAKVAKVLGPKGLMPNPKNGTISTKPQEAAKQYEGGQMRFKTELKSPIIHLSIGKLSFGEKKLSENITTVFKALPSEKVKNITLKSTMSPGIKINLA